MSVYKKLLSVQYELKAPKGQYNSFGKYRYRSCEDILEAVKPLLNKNNASITVYDEVVEICNRIYIKSTATFIDVETGETLTNTAFAREEETKKGMDGSQITGTASSYARKYSLSGLLLLDDSKDADTNGFTAQVQGTDAPKIYCDDCNSEIVAVRKKDGTMWEPEVMAAYGIRMYKKSLCSECLKKAAKAAK